MSGEGRIEDNPSAAELLRLTRGMGRLSKLVSFLEKFGVRSDRVSDAFEGISDLVQQAEELVNMPDRFNDRFSERGWVAYDSMNPDLMRQAVELANAERAEEAEALLTNYYDVETVRQNLRRMYAVKEFRQREDLAYKALDDYAAQRYYACVPVVFALMDGLVCDVEGRSLFAEGTDLTAWDSIAAHSTGLLTLAKLFSKTRRKTTTENISIPYRNGIIHGRDLGYANATVAAKTWAALFVVRDWAVAVKAGKRSQPQKDKEVSLWETIQSWAGIQEQKRKLDLWRPREVVVGKDCPVTGLPEAFAEHSPERTLARLMMYWSENNFGNMGMLFKQFVNASKNKFAGRVREMFQGKELKGFEILSTTDKASAVTEIDVRVIYDRGGDTRERCVTVRMLYEEPNGSPASRDDSDGKWKIIPNAFSGIAYDA